MPQEITKHSEVLEAVKSIKAIADLAACHDGHYDYELDLEVTVYGRNYSGKKVGPYVRLLTYSPGEEIVREGEWGGNSFYFVVKGKAEVFVQGGGGETKVAEIPAPLQFGEMSVLAGVPRAATVRAPQSEPVQVLEVQRPALRLLRKLPAFGETLDTNYRRYGRAATLHALGAATKLDPELIKQLEAISQFRVFSKNHLLFRVGEPIRRIYLLRSGWVKLSPGTQLVHISDQDGRDWAALANEGFIGPSHCFGLEGLTRDRQWPQTATVLGRTEVLEISISKLRQYPELREALMAALGPLAVPSLTAEQRLPLPLAKAQSELIETGLVDGTNLLVMDMDLCVRCGNCSLACHRVHGQSRLLRRGIHIIRPISLKKNSGFQSLLSPAVCMHCQDPECLTGCPTGAIGRFAGGEVDIDPRKCIGCGDCATQCPYNAISMVPRKSTGSDRVNRWRSWFRLASDPLPEAVETVEDLLAVKCNLCRGTTLNPPGARTRAYSCEENCPTGALLRVDPRTYFTEIKQITGLLFKDATHAVGRHLSHKDPGKRLAHVTGLIITLALTAFTILGIMRYGLETPLLGRWLDLRWLTGLVGLVGIIGVMAYPVRRQIYRRRAGPLRYWMLAHTYLGVIAGIVLLLHGGSSSGGALTTALMISFDLVILTGLFGILCYLLAPRLLTRIEGQPLLIEDLTERREELSQEISRMMAAASGQVRELIKRRVLGRFLSFGYLMRQYLGQESLEAMVQAARAEFQATAESLPEPEREALLRTVELAVTLRRCDALIYLHQLLKLWLAPHVLVTSLMLALMVVHIIQVVYFASW
jgi:Fe-S-cluster-containing dehydrogenase component/CRP-like cAMP-binding protein